MEVIAALDDWLGLIVVVSLAAAGGVYGLLMLTDEMEDE